MLELQIIVQKSLSEWLLRNKKLMLIIYPNKN